MPQGERSRTKDCEKNHGNDGEFRDWVQSSTECEYSARCKYCKKTIEHGSMGKSALRSHARGSKHQNLVAAAQSTPSVFALVSQSQSVARSDAVPQPASDRQSAVPSVAVHPPTPRPTTSNGTISNFMHSPELVDDVISAETMWVVHGVMNNSSFHSNSSINKVFLKMFHDSAIAKKIPIW